MFLKVLYLYLKLLFGLLVSIQNMTWEQKRYSQSFGLPSLRLRTAWENNSFGIYAAYNGNKNNAWFSYIFSVQVNNFDHAPKGMINQIIPEHLYVVFKHNGIIFILPGTLKYVYE